MTAGAVRDLPDLISAIDVMTRAVAGADPVTLDLLTACQQCRNSLLYLPGTEQYRGGYGHMFDHRLRATAGNHHGHSAPDSPDQAKPVIRGISS